MPVWCCSVLGYHNLFFFYCYQSDFISGINDVCHPAVVGLTSLAIISGRQISDRSTIDAGDCQKMHS